MGEEKKNEEKDEDRFSEENMKKWNSYSMEMNKARNYPINEFEHGAYLVDSEKEEISNYSQLVDRSIQLGNIGDDTLMRLEQTSAALLVNFYDMARRERGLQHFFAIRYHEWRSEILLTKAKDGGEREKQGAIGTKYIPQSRQVSGYGSSMDFNPQQQENEDKGLLNGLFPKKKR